MIKSAPMHSSGGNITKTIIFLISKTKPSDSLPEQTYCVLHRQRQLFGTLIHPPHMLIRSAYTNMFTLVDIITLTAHITVLRVAPI